MEINAIILFHSIVSKYNYLLRKTYIKKFVSLHKTSSHPIIEGCFVTFVMKETLNRLRLRGSMFQRLKF